MQTPDDMDRSRLSARASLFGGVCRGTAAAVLTGDGMAIALYGGLAAAQAVLEGHDAAACQRALVRA
jgi:hypothetical protein